MEINIPVEALRERKILCATPMYGGQCSGMFSKSTADLAALCAQYQIPLQYYFLFNESLITRARNYCCDEFMRSPAEHLMFIDADIGFSPQDIIALMALQTQFEQFDIIGGPYPKKCISWEKIKAAVDKGVADEDPSVLEKFVGDFVFNPKIGQQQIPIGEPVEVLEIGTGFMMIRKDAMKKFYDAYPQYLYKPDHARTEHFDGSREILQFFQAEIDPVSKRYLSEDYWFCCRNSTPIVTEQHGIKTIKELVDNKYSGKVRSITEDGKVEWNRVIGWSVHENGENGIKKHWVRLNTASDNNKVAKLYCTDDHRIATIFNPLKPELEYVEAGQSEGLYAIRDHNDNANINPLYNKDGISFLIGTLLGDAHVSKNGQVNLQHSKLQLEYLEMKQLIFGGSEIKLRSNDRGGFKVSKDVGYCTLPVNAQTKYLRELMYVNGRKTPINIINYIDAKALAFWYMDDGSRIGYDARLHTYSFTTEENELIIEYLKKRFELNAHVSFTTTKYKGEIKKYPYIRFNKESSEKFFDLIRPYIIETMLYKIPDDYADVGSSDYNDNYHGNYHYKHSVLDYAATLIKEVGYVVDQGKLYDIEVENAHSFVASGTFVHNCQKAQAIGLKTWLCPWMKTQHVGAYVFGGSLADLASINVAATVDPDALGKNKKKVNKIKDLKEAEKVA